MPSRSIFLQSQSFLLERRSKLFSKRNSSKSTKMKAFVSVVKYFSAERRDTKNIPWITQLQKSARRAVELCASFENFWNVPYSEFKKINFPENSIFSEKMHKRTKTPQIPHKFLKKALLIECNVILVLGVRLRGCCDRQTAGIRWLRTANSTTCHPQGRQGWRSWNHNLHSHHPVRQGTRHRRKLQNTVRRDNFRRRRKFNRWSN